MTQASGTPEPDAPLRPSHGTSIHDPDGGWHCCNENCKRWKSVPLTVENNPFEFLNCLSCRKLMCGKCERKLSLASLESSDEDPKS